MPTSSYIVCPELPVCEAMDLDGIHDLFRTATSCELGQSWRNNPEEGFMPATVRAGWRNDTLLLLAELQDNDIFTTAKNPNERLWELGDTLEIFLRPVEQSAYVEFHIAPNNLRLQLRFD